MEIALVVPSMSRPTGNAVSARRIAAALGAAGARPRILDLDQLGPYVPDVIAAWEPDVVHALHARRTGWLVRDCRPLVISLTGTDSGRDLEVEGKREQVLEACRAAHALVVHHRATAEPVEALEASLGDKVRVVPKGLSLTEEAEFPLRKVFGIPPERAVFLLAGGLRPVKGQLRAIFALDGLGVELVLAGPALDPEYSGAVRREASSRPWVRMIEVRPHARMAGAYRDCDVVLNCSAVEGMPNALVEAMHFGRAILASDVPGNRSLVEPAVNGLLFAGDDDLRAKARDLAGNPALRATLGAAGAIRAKANHDAVAEARALMQIYREAAGDGRGGG